MKNNRDIIGRRALLRGATLGGSALILSGCDALNESDMFRSALRTAETLNQTVHRSLMDRAALAPEFPASDISPVFKTNGSLTGTSAEYLAHVDDKFADWTLRIDGMVAKPMDVSLETLRAMPSRTQITRHDCVEGWSAIAKWQARAKYIVFHCADSYGAQPYYESIDLIDAFHPQTILAWGMNGEMLPVKYGAPVRLRVERQLGYKHAKYVMRIEATDDLTKFHGGKGGYWEDVGDYEWYAGI
ncbi:molybdopterin-dependent oxidoreductase [Sphingorhabdus sp.]|uniref:molybdopterin-dependent oxidoreductase n=1 Tax=Sphingorhabdus sp. TaxID=1902408 RepID=UPI0039BD1BBD